MNVDMPELALVVACTLFIAKPLAEVVLARLSGRAADWLLPENRPSSYRIARAICRVCGWIAPRGSGARRAREGVLADIEEIARVRPCGPDPFPLACSLLLPSLHARLVATGGVVIEMIGWSALLVLSCAAMLVPIVNVGYGYASAEFAVTGYFGGSRAADRPMYALTCAWPAIVVALSTWALVAGIYTALAIAAVTCSLPALGAIAWVASFRLVEASGMRRRRRATR